MKRLPIAGIISPRNADGFKNFISVSSNPEMFFNCIRLMNILNDYQRRILDIQLECLFECCFCVPVLFKTVLSREKLQQYDV